MSWLGCVPSARRPAWRSWPWPPACPNVMSDAWFYQQLREDGTTSSSFLTVMLRRIYGKQKQGIGFDHAKVGGYNVWLRGYNPLVATVSTPLSAPVVAARRLRSGNTGSSKDAASMIAETIGTAQPAARPATSSCGPTRRSTPICGESTLPPHHIGANLFNSDQHKPRRWIEAQPRASCTRIATCTRLAQPSFVISRETYVFTVATLMNNSPLISALDLPAATARATSRSRSVSPSIARRAAFTRTCCSSWSSTRTT